MRLWMRLALVGAGLALVLAVTLGGGLRQGLLALLGIGFGAVLQGARFGFTTGWRNYIENRDPQGLWAQMLLLVLAAAFTLPLIAGNPGELVGAVAPLTISLVLGAFLFGAAMQLADGCGSGTLYKAGAGAPISFAVLPTFAIGSLSVPRTSRRGLRSAACRRSTCCNSAGRLRWPSPWPAAAWLPGWRHAARTSIAPR